MGHHRGGLSRSRVDDVVDVDVVVVEHSVLLFVLETFRSPTLSITYSEEPKP